MRPYVANFQIEDVRRALAEEKARTASMETELAGVRKTVSTLRTKLRTTKAKMCVELAEMRHKCRHITGEAQRFRALLRTLGQAVEDGDTDGAIGIARDTLHGTVLSSQRLTFGPGAEISMHGWVAGLLATNMVALLDEVGAKNNCTWHMRHKGRKVIMTAQWAHGETVDQQRDAALAEVVRLRALLAAIVPTAK